MTIEQKLVEEWREFVKARTEIFTKTPWVKQETDEQWWTRKRREELEALLESIRGQKHRIDSDDLPLLPWQKTVNDTLTYVEHLIQSLMK